jgi:tripartite ATP-independent transporter DctP family solute receptor
MKKKLYLLSLLSLVLVLGVFAGGQGEGTGEADTKVYEFKYAATVVEQDPRAQSMIYFKKILEEKTDRIVVENYFGGVLGNDSELFDMVKTGDVQGYRGGRYAYANPRFELMTQPFLFGTWEEAIAFLKSDLWRSICKEAEANGFYVPATAINRGFRCFTNNVRPIEKVEDFKGLKMRIPPGKIYVEMAKAFEINAQEVGITELYMALKTGVVDGQDNPLINDLSRKFYEVQKYLSITNHLINPDPMIVNLEWYESLPKDLQKVFDEAAEEHIVWTDNENAKTNDQVLAELSKYMQVNYITEENLRAFMEKAKKVYQVYIDEGILTQKDFDEVAKIRAKVK